MFQGKKLIIFDMDGTLIDSVDVWNEVDKGLIQALGGEAPEKPEIQRNRDQELRKYSKDPNPYERYCGDLGARYGSGLSPKEIVALRYQVAHRYLAEVIDFKPGADTYIKALKAAGYTLVIASTTKRNNMEIYRTQNKNIMSKAPLDEYFARIYTREDTPEMKPNPAIYYRIQKEFGVKAEECIIFEDSLIGIEAAGNAGIDSVAMYDVYADGEREQINAIATWRFQDYQEALGALYRELGFTTCFQSLR